jgi:hypothetical protein
MTQYAQPGSDEMEKTKWTSKSKALLSCERQALWRELNSATELVISLFGPNSKPSKKSTESGSKPSFCWCLVWPIPWPWRWKWNYLLKCRAVWTTWEAYTLQNHCQKGLQSNKWTSDLNVTFAQLLMAQYFSCHNDFQLSSYYLFSLYSCFILKHLPTKNLNWRFVFFRPFLPHFVLIIRSQWIIMAHFVNAIVIRTQFTI